MIIALYAFCLPWVFGAIIVRYWSQKDYDAVLVGLDDTAARRFFMVGHMSLGSVCLILGPTQFLRVIRRKWPRFHRWSGRVYIFSAVLCSVFGLIFICLKGFILVGGLNMGFAFAAAGTIFGFCAIMTAVHARNGAMSRHRNWAIRAYGQVLAPMLYRYFYLILGGLGLYSYDGMPCDENDVCHQFTRLFDSIHAWTYFLFPLLCSELIVRVIPKEPESPHPIDHAEANQDQTSQQRREGEEQCTGEDLEAQKKQKAGFLFDYSRLNILGIIGALASFGSTVLIYATAALGTNTVTN